MLSEPTANENENENPNLITEEDNRRLREAHFQEIITENTKLKERINQLTAFLYQITNQYEEDFFNDSMAFMQRQSIIRAIKARLTMSPEIWEIVNKSKQPQTEPSTQ